MLGVRLRQLVGPESLAPPSRQVRAERLRDKIPRHVWVAILEAKAAMFLSPRGSLRLWLPALPLHLRQTLHTGPGDASGFTKIQGALGGEEKVVDVDLTS